MPPGPFDTLAFDVAPCSLPYSRGCQGSCFIASVTRIYPRLSGRICVRLAEFVVQKADALVDTVAPFDLAVPVVRGRRWGVHGRRLVGFGLDVAVSPAEWRTDNYRLNRRRVVVVRRSGMMHPVAD